MSLRLGTAQGRRPSPASCLPSTHQEGDAAQFLECKFLGVDYIRWGPPARPVRRSEGVSCDCSSGHFLVACAGLVSVVEPWLSWAIDVCVQRHRRRVCGMFVVSSLRRRVCRRCGTVCRRDWYLPYYSHPCYRALPTPLSSFLDTPPTCHHVRLGPHARLMRETSRFVAVASHDSSREGEGGGKRGAPQR